MRKPNGFDDMYQQSEPKIKIQFVARPCGYIKTIKVLEHHEISIASNAPLLYPYFRK